MDLSEIVKKCEKDYKAVKKTFLQIREHFKYCDYLTPLGIGESHRVKINGEWITGSLAEYYENQAKNLLRKKPDDPIFNGLWVTSMEYWEKFGVTSVDEFDMASLLGVVQYIKAWGIGSTTQLLDDIHFAKMELLKTFDLKYVQDEIAERQKNSKLEVVYTIKNSDVCVYDLLEF